MVWRVAWALALPSPLEVGWGRGRGGGVRLASSRGRASMSSRWNRAKQASHDGLIELTKRAVLESLGGKEGSCIVHTEMPIIALPAEYGLPREPPEALLTPDLVVFDRHGRRLLLIEVTIVPCAALPKYEARKARKYFGLHTRARPSELDVLPPLVIAVGTGGTIPRSSVEAARVIGLSEKERSTFFEEAAAIAQARPDARRQKKRNHSMDESLPRLRGTRAERKLLRRSGVADPHPQ